MKTKWILLLTFVFAVGTAFGQAVTKPPAIDKTEEGLFASLEEIAMCHHAIGTVKHEAVEDEQNPIHRYVLGLVVPGHSRFPSPERCKNAALMWIVPYAELTEKDKVSSDRWVSDRIGFSISDMAKDVDFMTIIVNKMLLEGDRAGFLENENRHIPGP